MGKLLSTYNALLFGKRRYLLYSLLSQTLMVFFTVFSTFLSKVIVDTITHDLEEALLVERWVITLVSFGQGEAYLYANAFYLLPGALLIAGSLLAISTALRMSLRSYADSAMNSSIQTVLFTRLESLPYPYYKDHAPGDLIQIMTRDIDVARRFLTMELGSFNYAFWIVLFCSSLLLSISWKFALCSVALFPCLFIYSFFVVKEVRKRYRDADESEARITDRITENLNSVRIVKAFNSETKEIAGFERYLGDYHDKFVRWRKMSSFFYASADIFTFGSSLLSLAFGIYFAWTGEINSGTLVIALSFVSMMVWPLRESATSLSNVGQCLASVDRIRLILDAETEDVDTGLTPPQEKDIVLDHVHFSYPGDEKETIKDVSFAIPYGSSVALMGKTGSGKSTLLLLLTRLYEYSSGSIKIGETELKDIQKNYLRRRIVPVLQDPFLFSKSIAKNIEMAKKGVDFESIRHAARVAHIDKTIESFRDGYDTAVGEKGMSLSGGQKQRVAIARALITEPAVLIFDDSLSAVDSETDLAIRKNLEQEGRKNTKIIITHRISTAKDCDLIVVMEEGRVKEIGNDATLRHAGGLYQEIAEIQGKML